MSARTCLKCRNCGGPMYFDAAANAFHCAYCGENTPYDVDIGAPAGDPVLKHVPAPVVNGAFALKGLSEPHDMKYFGTGINLETWEIKANESYFGWRKPGTIEDREKVSFLCTSCGALVEGYGSQNIWTCEYCGNKYAKDDLLATGWYEPNWHFKGTKYNEKDKTFTTLTDRDRPIPRYAAPFEISLKDAQQKILEFVDEHPKAFADVDMREHVKNLRAVYFCYYLCDTTVLMSMNMTKGRTILMKDAVNWAVPASGNHGTELLHDIGPWDFGALKAFVPAFAEGDIWFDRPWGDDNSPYYYLQCADLTKEAVKLTNELYGCDDAELEWVRTWDRNKVRVYLPAYYLGRTAGAKFCFAVNGQTGTLSCMGKGKSQGRKTWVKEGNLRAVERSGEPIVMTPFYTVKQVDAGAETYKIVDAQEAYVKKGFFERRRK